MALHKLLAVVITIFRPPRVIHSTTLNFWAGLILTSVVMLIRLDNKVMAEFECELTNSTANETWYPSHKPYFILAVKITVGTTCVLSILGASLIILTYLAFHDLRTTARKLLVNLSVADIVVAASHFVGLFTNYERFLHNGNSRNADVRCSIQAGFTMYGSIASILWTIAVALYMFTVIVLRKPTTAKRTLPVYFLVCWGVPVVFTVSFGLKKYLGFEQSVDIGRFTNVLLYYNCTSSTCFQSLLLAKGITVSPSGLFM